MILFNEWYNSNIADKDDRGNRYSHMSDAWHACFSEIVNHLKTSGFNEATRTLTGEYTSVQGKSFDLESDCIVDIIQWIMKGNSFPSLNDIGPINKIKHKAFIKRLEQELKKSYLVSFYEKVKEHGNS